MPKPAIFVYGPAGCGKTHHRFDIADMFGIPHSRIIDDWPGYGWSPGGLYLTQFRPFGLEARADAVLIPFSAFLFRDGPRTLWNGEPINRGVSGQQVVAQKQAEPEVEWGPPIATPGDNCPDWATSEAFTTAQFQRNDDWITLHDFHFPTVRQWHWPTIQALRFPVGHPVYAEREAADAKALLEAQGYKVEPPAPPEPDYEAYREKLIAYVEGAGTKDTWARRLRRKESLLRQDCASIRGLIAAGVTP